MGQLVEPEGDNSMGVAAAVRDALESYSWREAEWAERLLSPVYAGLPEECRPVPWYPVGGDRPAQWLVLVRRLLM